MTNGQPTVLRHLRKIVAAQTFRDLPDRELLVRFVDRRDEDAFAALVERHGTMTLGVCRRVLRRVHDAEDACQATFLVLARKASSIRKKDSLASWLHGVAFRVASDLKKRLARQRNGSGIDDISRGDTVREVTWREAQAVLDEELNGLADCHRAPLVLCYLEGKARDEAAHQLGWNERTLRTRLERGRELLRARLLRRGIAPSVALFSAVFAETASATMPPSVALATAKAAALVALGKTLSGTVIPNHVVSLAEGVLKAMFLTKLKTTGVLFLLVSLVGVALGFAGAPDGQHLATAGPDGAVVARLDQDRKPVLPNLQLTEKELAALWADLASKDTGKVNEAARLLRADPGRSTPFLRERLNSNVPRLELLKVQQLIADLDAVKFDTREQATKELRKLGKAVERALQAALASAPNLETRRRLEVLLKGMGENVALTPEQERDVRAVRLLEQLGTPGARQALEALAKDAPGWWVVREATAALERLDRSAKKP